MSATIKTLINAKTALKNNGTYSESNQKEIQTKSQMAQVDYLFLLNSLYKTTAGLARHLHCYPTPNCLPLESDFSMVNITKKDLIAKIKQPLCNSITMGMSFNLSGHQPPQSNNYIDSQLQVSILKTIPSEDDIYRKVHKAVNPTHEAYAEHNKLGKTCIEKTKVLEAVTDAQRHTPKHGKPFDISDYQKELNNLEARRSKLSIDIIGKRKTLDTYHVRHLSNATLENQIWILEDELDSIQAKILNLTVTSSSKV